MFGKSVIVVLVFTNIAAMVFGTFLPYQARQQERGLSVMEANKEKVEGMYHGSSGSIRFSSKAMNGDRSVAITTAEGKPIFISNLPELSTITTMTLGNTKFVATMNQPGSGLPKYSDYVVPEALHNHVEFAAKQNHLHNAVLQYLDAKSANATRQRAVEDLISRGEADLIVEAAKALGRAGVMGSESQAAQQFYVLAMRLDKIKDQLMRSQVAQVSNKPYPVPLYSQALFSRRQQKRAACQTGCTTGICPTGSDCFGMCGKDCFCWFWVCGDCCVHQGCLEHDRCCENDFWSFGCVIPFGFDCSGYTC